MFWLPFWAAAEVPPPIPFEWDDHRIVDQTTGQFIPTRGRTILTQKALPLQSGIWAVVSREGGQGNGNNASGAYTYAVQLVRETPFSLSDPVATLGEHTFSRWQVGGEIGASGSWTVQCVALQGDGLATYQRDLARTDPRDHGHQDPYEMLCTKPNRARTALLTERCPTPLPHLASTPCRAGPAPTSLGTATAGPCSA